MEGKDTAGAVPFLFQQKTLTRGELEKIGIQCAVTTGDTVVLPCLYTIAGGRMAT